MTSRTELLISLTARSHLTDVYQFTLAKWGEEQADRYENELYEAFERIRDFPGIGRGYQTAEGDVRVLPVGQHLIYYHQLPDAVVIMRIVSVRQRR